MGARSGQAPLRVDGYVRVSRVGKRKGKRFISPRVQRRAIEEWAGSRRVELLGVYEELDEPGTRADRPLLEEVVARCHDRTSHGLVVYRVDRYGRSLLDGLVTLDRIRAAGGEFFSAADGLDTSTDTGRLVVRILLSMAEWELERIRENWDQARADAIGRGIHAGHIVPAGYRRSRSGPLVPDPDTGPVIAELFRRRAAGDSVAVLSKWLEDQGVPTAVGNPRWCEATTMRVLSNPVYLGQARCGPHINERAHQPLADPATWQRVQEPRSMAAPRFRESSLLTGMVRCASCSMRIQFHPERDGDKHRGTYACRKQSAAGMCPAPASMSSRALERLVVEVFFGLLARRRRAPHRRVEAAQATLTATEDALIAYRDSQRLLQILGEERFAEGLDMRVRRVNRARAELSTATQRLGVHALPPVDEVRRSWPTMTNGQRRDALHQAIDVVFVEPGRLRYEERIMVCPRGTGPHDIPRPGRPRAQLRAQHMRRTWVRPRAAAQAAAAPALSPRVDVACIGPDTVV